MKNDRKSTMKFVVALLGTVSTATLAIAATPAAAMNQTALEKFNKSDYNFCDATLVGKLFGVDAARGKVKIGETIKSGTNGPKAILANSRNQGHQCSWGDTLHSYADAEKLGRFWGVSTSEAKSKVASYYTAGNSTFISKALASNVQNGNSTPSKIDLYEQSGFNFCDAKLVGALFGGTPYDGKITIGQKISNGASANIPAVLAQSRNANNKCAWGDVPHNYADAEKLGRVWGVSTSEAKSKAATFYTDGLSNMVSRALTQ